MLRKYDYGDDLNWFAMLLLIAMAIVFIPIMMAIEVGKREWRNYKMSKEDAGWWFATAIGLGAGLLLLLTVIIYCATR